jgi:hypothetical protein
VDSHAIDRTRATAATTFDARTSQLNGVRTYPYGLGVVPGETGEFHASGSGLERDPNRTSQDCSAHGPLPIRSGGGTGGQGGRAGKQLSQRAIYGVAFLSMYAMSEILSGAIELATAWLGE